MATVSTNDSRDKGTGAAVFALTKWTQDYAMDCDAAAVAETNDVLATLIADLIRQGIIKGSVTTS